MTAKDIQYHLGYFFGNYEYHLRNAYVFSWESDFFCESKSGYITEVEIKVSRADFFKDFDKDKHKVFNDLVSGKTHCCKKSKYGNSPVEAILVKSFSTPEIWVKPRYRNDGIKNGSEPLIERNYKGGGYIVNDWQDRLMIEKRRYGRDLFAPFTSVIFLDLKKTSLPHKFIYATPKGLLKPEEAPAYAGLIEIQQNNVVEIKKAPFMHKRKDMDLTGILLSKFYNLWRYKSGKYRTESAEVQDSNE